MKHSFILSFVVALCISAGFVGVASANDDMKTLQGTWTLVSGEKDGDPLSDHDVKNSKLTIVGDTYAVQLGDTSLKGNQEFDSTKTPKQIDANETEGPTIGLNLGIYEFTPEGDFRVCFAPRGKERPNDFVTKPDSGYFVHVWHRLKGE